MLDGKAKSNTPITSQMKEDSEGLEEHDEQRDVLEKMEERKLQEQYPHLRGAPTAFLQKRLQQRKFFDSGDYNMAKAKGMKFPASQAKAAEAKSPVKEQQRPETTPIHETGVETTCPTGTEIPTADKILARKASAAHATGTKFSPSSVIHQPSADHSANIE